MQALQSFWVCQKAVGLVLGLCSIPPVISSHHVRSVWRLKLQSDAESNTNEMFFCFVFAVNQPVSLVDEWSFACTGSTVVDPHANISHWWLQGSEKHFKESLMHSLSWQGYIWQRCSNRQKITLNRKNCAGGKSAVNSGEASSRPIIYDDIDSHQRHTWRADESFTADQCCESMKLSDLKYIREIAMDTALKATLLQYHSWPHGDVKISCVDNPVVMKGDHPAVL